MVLRAALLGLFLWLCSIMAFRVWGEIFYEAGTLGPAILFSLAAPASAGLTWALVRLLRVSPGDEAEASVGLAFPGMALNAFVLPSFGSVFPLLDPTLDGEFGGATLIASAAMIFTGLMLTRLSPKDERI